MSFETADWRQPDVADVGYCFAVVIVVAAGDVHLQFSSTKQKRRYKNIAAETKKS